MNKRFDGKVLLRWWQNRQAGKSSWARVLDGGLTVVILGLVFGLSWQVYASLDAPSAPTDPGSQSYTLADVCNRLETGAEGTIATTFTDYESAPDQDMCTLNEIYGLTPQPNEAAAAQAGDVLDGKTFWALNPSGQWGLTTGTVTEFQPFSLLPATGVNTCYDASGAVINCAGTGQDGEYQLGATADPRFTDNSDGTVTDNLTGLIWLKNANCFGTRTWETALNDANTLSNGSCSLSDGSASGDWRLPNRKEMLSLSDWQEFNPGLPSGHPFTNVINDFYKTSSTKVNDQTRSWMWNGVTGNVSFVIKSQSNYVWPVRSSSP